MKYVFLCSFLLVTVAACTSAEANRPGQADFAACGVDAAEHARLMALSQDAFDQDMDGGWRPVGQRDGCRRVAAHLLLDYAETHGLTPDDGVVTWHAAQMFAQAGDYNDALRMFRREYDPTLGPDDEHYDWTLYGRGTVEFLEGDRPALERTISQYAALPVDQERKDALLRYAEENNVSFPPEVLAGRPANLVVLEGLLRCFGEPYDVAYGQCPKTD